MSVLENFYDPYSFLLNTKIHRDQKDIEYSADNFICRKKFQLHDCYSKCKKLPPSLLMYAFTVFACLM
jgi:hypothetical protein